MKIVAIINQKGGVGKTTTCVNLSVELAHRGHRVLIVDTDPQGNCSSGLGWMKDSSPTLYECLVDDQPAGSALVQTAWGPWLLPATVSLAGAELDLASAISRETRLARCLAPLADRFDVAFLDCPPALGLLTVNALTAAHLTLIPIQCEYYAMEGLGLLTRTIETVRHNLNASLGLNAIVLTMYDQRTRLSEEVAAQIRETFGDVVLKVEVPRNVSLAEAPSFGQPIGAYAPASRGAIAYAELAREVEEKWL